MNEGDLVGFEGPGRGPSVPCPPGQAGLKGKGSPRVDGLDVLATRDRGRA